MAGTIVADTLQDGAGNSTAMDNAIYGSAKAWVNYNAVSQTIKASYNVSSVTHSATGVYVVNFTNALTDSNYATIAGASPGITYSLTTGAWFAGVSINGSNGIVNKTSSSVTVVSAYYSGPGGAVDSPDYSIAVFR
jgi:hypothetical protein